MRRATQVNRRRGINPASLPLDPCENDHFGMFLFRCAVNLMCGVGFIAVMTWEVW